MTAPSEVEALVARLKRRNGGWTSNVTYREDGGDPINPDGPAAAALILSQAATIAARDAELRTLSANSAALIAEAADEHTALRATIAALEARVGQFGYALDAAEFLSDRLEELSDEGMNEHCARDFYGHVVPAQERLRQHLAARQLTEQKP